jgi:uncharacterized protein (DUF2235 family)
MLKNLVLCFDRAGHHPGLRDATNAERLFRLLDEDAEQIAWYDPGTQTVDRGFLRRAMRWRKTAAGDARAAVAEAYDFLLDSWEPGDRIYMFGVGRGGYCAQTLTRLLGTVGLLPELKDYVLAAYAAPRTRRTPEDWQRVTRLFAELSPQHETSVPVWFLGLWDAVRVPGLRRSMPDPMPNVVFGRHAVAIDGPPGERPVAAASERIEEVWFRGAHRDVAGGPGACRPLADITLDWMLDGAAKAGVSVDSSRRCTAPTPGEYDPLAGSARTISVRKVPADSLVHSSVDVYLREHAEYWRRLPAHVIWADVDWAARSERLMPATTPPVRVERPVLAALAS